MDNYGKILKADVWKMQDIHVYPADTIINPF